jgi:hypothetical protein
MNALWKTWHAFQEPRGNENRAGDPATANGGGERLLDAGPYVVKDTAAQLVPPPGICVVVTPSRVRAERPQVWHKSNADREITATKGLRTEK